MFVGLAGFVILCAAAVVSRPSPLPNGRPGADVPTPVLVVGFSLLALGGLFFVAGQMRDRRSDDS